MSFAPIAGNEFAGVQGAGFPGLNETPRDTWPSVVQAGGRSIDALRPRSQHHAFVLNYLLNRLHTAEHEMSKFYARWRANERRLQAWIDLPDWEKIMKDAADAGKVPMATQIVVPYTFATQATIATYMLQVFMGKKPYFQVSTYNTEVERALKMEIALQFQADHRRLMKHMWQFFNDWQTYGFSALRTKWITEFAPRTRVVEQPVFDMRTGAINTEQTRQQEIVKIFEGNDVAAQDPFMLFPDPRVPMTELSEKGEYVFWRLFQGKHELLKAQEDSIFKWVNAASTTIPVSARGFAGGIESARDVLSRGIAHPGLSADSALWARGYYKVDQCSVQLIPRELGLGFSEKVELWLFTILNDSQIVQAERLISDHNHHPIVITEPLTMGYGFGSAGYSDYLGGFQDTMSWFLNSHMENVRTGVNNIFIYDPTMVEKKDVLNPEPGKRIRLKPSAIGRDVRSVFSQVPVNDVTRGHINDMQTFMEIGQRISAVTDNLLGLQDPGGRKTATEVRGSNQAAASRLAALTKMVSAQGMTELTYQMSLNTQQWMTDEFWVRIHGPDGIKHPLRIGREELTGDFHYPIHDGTLPLDRIALFDLWRQIMEGVLQDPEVRQTYSVPKIFEFVAELGGAKNIRNFRLSPQDPSLIDQQAQAGNLAPIPNANGPSGLVNAFTSQGGNRLANAGLQ